VSKATALVVAGYEIQVGCDYASCLCRCREGCYSRWPWRTLERCVELAVRHALRCRAKVQRREAEQRLAEDHLRALKEVYDV